jgi:imidazolonepropionase
MPQTCDALLENANLATMLRVGQPYGAVHDGAVAIAGGSIIYAGPRADLPDLVPAVVHNCQGGWLTPGLIDCHTHLVFAGNRAGEFEQRLNGASYEDIARAGGGIISTVKATRAADESELYDAARARLLRLLEEGVTTVEIKSGYGLDTQTELRMLRVARQLAQELPVTVKTTFLGAHALPPEFPDSDRYIDYLCSDMLPAVAEAGLADAVDVFCEGIGFSTAQCEKVFTAAGQYGLPVKGHVEQLSNLGGAVLACRYNALSVDHIEYLDPADVAALAQSATVAVLLPGAFYFLGEKQLPPIAALREQAVPMAVATDLNPGSSPIASLLFAANQACVLFGLTPEESLRGISCNAASALGLNNKGVLQAGADADIALWHIDQPADLVYGVNFHRPQAVWQEGKCDYRS